MPETRAFILPPYQNRSMCFISHRSLHYSVVFHIAKYKSFFLQYVPHIEIIGARFVKNSLFAQTGRMPLAEKLRELRDRIFQ